MVRRMQTGSTQSSIASPLLYRQIGKMLLIVMALCLAVPLSLAEQASELAGQEAENSYSPDGDRELREDVIANAENERVFFVIANLEHTLAHEMGHVILDEFDIPVLGNMEVAADQLGIFLFSSLMGGNDNFVQGKLDILQAIADEMRLEWGARPEADREHYWSSHPFEPQRFYNTACMIYGSEPKVLEHIRDFAEIPPARAFYCRDEYETAAQAVSWVISRAGRKTAYTANPEDHKISIEYEEPHSQRSEKIRGWLEETGVITSITHRAEELFDFQRPLRVSVANCQYPGAMWMSGKGEILLCYQLMERYYYLADHRDATETDAVLDMSEWNAFCLYESVAEHYSSYCSKSLGNPGQ